MSENKMSDMIRASLEGIRGFADMDAVIGTPILTPGGVTVIPISKITLTLATGGLDYGRGRGAPSQNFGGAGGTGVSIMPLGFLTVSSSGDTRLIPLGEASQDSSPDRLSSLIERAPEIIEKIKNSFS